MLRGFGRDLSPKDIANQIVDCLPSNDVIESVREPMSSMRISYMFFSLRRRFAVSVSSIFTLASHSFPAESRSLFRTALNRRPSSSCRRRLLIAVHCQGDARQASAIDDHWRIHLSNARVSRSRRAEVCHYVLP